MPRLRPLRFLALAALLCGCQRNADNFAPRIVITYPEGSGATQTRELLIKGYALDDVGVRRISVDGRNVPIQAGSRKIARFQFKATLPKDKAEFKIRASDRSGHESLLTLPVVIDTVKPQLSIKSVERVGDTLRISGIASDNVRVSQIVIDGTRLNINPGERVEFYAETQGKAAQVEVLDAAANKVTAKVTEPKTPPPNAASPTGTNSASPAKTTSAPQGTSRRSRRTTPNR